MSHLFFNLIYIFTHYLIGLIMKGEKMEKLSNAISFKVVIYVNGFVINDQKLINAVLSAREKMCGIMNDKGGVKKYNELAELLDIIQEDEYIDIYESLANLCWTHLLNEAGYDYKIVGEIYIENKNNIVTRLFNGVNGVWKINLISI